MINASAHIWPHLASKTKVDDVGNIWLVSRSVLHITTHSLSGQRVAYILRKREKDSTALFSVLKLWDSHVPTIRATSQVSEMTS